MSIRIITGDCVEQMRALPENSIDAIVTDPPYGLEFMGKEWDSFRYSNTGPQETKFKNLGELPTFSPNRRNQKCPNCGKWAYDHKGRKCECGGWKIAARNGYMAAFQMACFEWGVEMLRVLKPGGHLLAFGGTRTYHRLVAGLEDAGFEIRDSIHWVYGSGFPKSLNLDGGLGTALKPAHEPIVLARKPLSGTVAATVAKYGTGALNVDASRVAVEAGFEATSASGISSSADGWDRPWKHDPAARAARAARAAENAAKTADLGRWPPNFVLSHEESCVEGGKCAESCPVAEMDRQSGPAGSNSMESGPASVSGFLSGIGSNSHHDTRDAGGASRFFPVFRYEAKPSRAEREAGLREAAVATGSTDGDCIRNGAPRFVKIARNTHPTVKPVALMAWLIELVTPKGGTVLDPFLGSGTTAIAAQRVGRDCIGIEREAEYVAIAEARIRGDSPMFSKVEVL